MPAISEQILEQVLALPAQDRAEIVERLLASLQVPPDPDLDELWTREAEERLDAYDRGELGAVPAEEVFATVKQADAIISLVTNIRNPYAAPTMPIQI